MKNNLVYHRKVKIYRNKKLTTDIAPKPAIPLDIDTTYLPALRPAA